MSKSFLATSLLVAGLGASCVHQTEPTPLTGPSDLALSLRVTATPDTVTIDGGSQSAIVIEAHNAAGRPQVGLSLRLDTVVAQALRDCGTLSVRNVVTDKDGRATSVYTAPALPLPLPDCTNVIPGSTIDIVASSVGSNFQTSVSQTASIRLASPVVIVPPGSPIAIFTIPATVSKLVDVTFDGSASRAAPGRTITNYDWDFGDGVKKSGIIVTHDFFPAGDYLISLTVTDDIQQQMTRSLPLRVLP